MRRHNFTTEDSEKKNFRFFKNSVFSRRISFKRDNQTYNILCNRGSFIIRAWIIVEIKAVETMNKIYDAQLLTYLKAMNKRVGLLINFNLG